MNAQERVTELTQKMLRRKLYAIFGKTVASQEKLIPLLPAHLEYLIDLEKKGLLFASGPGFGCWPIATTRRAPGPASESLQ
jgi:hypothetical protein